MSGSENYVNNGVWQVTKREMQDAAGSARFWTGLICVVVLLTVSGPFETATLFNLPQRFAYWAAIGVSTYFLALVCMVPIFVVTTRKNWHWFGSSALAGVVAGVPLALFIYIVNVFILEEDAGVRELLHLAIACCVIAIAVCCLRVLLMAPASAPQAETINISTFLNRLSPENRGEIISLQAQDHYIEVLTSKGKELILMRLGDAATELESLDAMRIHRSWWVTREAVEMLAPSKDRLSLKLIDGREVPVSRANEKAVRNWLA